MPLVRSLSVAILCALSVLAAQWPGIVQGPGTLQAQWIFGPSNQFELAGKVRVDEIDTETQNKIQRVQALAAGRQWADTVDALRELIDQDSGQLIATSSRRYLGVRDYCQMLLATLDPAVLAIYREQVDPLAKELYTQAAEARDKARLRELLDTMYCSSWGDRALWTLGALELESGNTAAARTCWEELLAPLATDPPDDPTGRDAVDQAPPPDDAAPAQRTVKTGPLRRYFPDAQYAQADILARLVLVSIVEGSQQRAERELAGFRARFAQARGHLGGREVNYAEALGELLAALPAWPAPQVSPGWPTFAGSATRNWSGTTPLELGQPSWQIELPSAPSPAATYASRSVAEQRDRPLSIFPVVVDNLLLVQTHDTQIGQFELRAYNLQTGQAAWGNNPLIMPPEVDSGERTRTARGSLGTPRFTLTVHGSRLYARIGDPLTSTSADALNPHRSALVCLDLQREGSLVWRQQPAIDENWSYEGSPVCDGKYVYVVMRHSDILPQCHVACLDARTGELLWRRWIASAYTPAQGQIDEITHTQLTLADGMLYVSTNLGAVAALDTARGRLRWLTLYPRAASGELSRRAAHFHRDLTPPIYDRGRLFVAPSDSPLLLAIDAASGLLLWETNHGADAVHLLGVDQERLVASGQRLWFFRAETGYPLTDPWPQGTEPQGFGRGLLSAHHVYWPTRTAIYVFDVHTARQARQPIDLSSRGIYGGNLLVAGGYLLIVGHATITAFELPEHADTNPTANPRTANLQTTGQRIAGQPSAEQPPAAALRQQRAFTSTTQGDPLLTTSAHLPSTP